MITRRVLHSYWPDGDGSRLTLDFTTGVLDPRLTFTRSGTATFINASGLVATASNNVARFDHDPTTLTPKGLLIEGSATNLLNWSESFATSGGTNNNWADTNITRNSTNNADPANGTTALRVTASAGNGTIISTAAMGTSAERTFSIWLRRVSGTGNIQYTLDNGSTYTTQAITSSWVRYTFAATTAAQRVGIRIVTSGDSIELWGAQLETGFGASSYIPTGASQVTRNADFAVMTDISGIGFNIAGGSMVIRGYQTKLASGSYPALAAFLDASDVDVFGVRNDVAGSVMFGRFAGASTSAEATRSIANNASYAFGMSANPSITTGAITVSMNGSSTTGNKIGVATAISTPTKFAITRPGYGSFINCGTIISIKYWPTVKTAAELNALTT